MGVDEDYRVILRLGEEVTRLLEISEFREAEALLHVRGARLAKWAQQVAQSDEDFEGQLHELMEQTASIVEKVEFQLSTMGKTRHELLRAPAALAAYRVAQQQGLHANILNE
ncbi:hypothetical protein [Alicyclobacillus mali (ex Roth et al. 2021)]|uniref:hypothetical protein n=1 Tax=Alicyclobacillus mali (ex Roth et al. 2021) TaxID=1123961 RepID=UPI001A8DDCB6|nr:hypothetical protein [Alicyclobacillus mali (ex Roth et al. 2021)]